MMRIGVFDSGIGGLSTLLACLRYLPKAHFLFYGDTAHSPYGDKSPGQVRQWTEVAYDWFIRAGVDAVVLACNTATSAAVTPIREYADVPVIGIEPAIKRALTLYPEGKILLLATAMTVAGAKLEQLLAQLPEARQRVQALACPGLAERIESQSADWQEQVQQYLQRRVLPACTADVQALVLGCTHYCWISDWTSGLAGRAIPTLDGNDGVARQLCRRLDIPLAAETCPALPGTASVDFHFTADSAAKIHIAQQLLAAYGIRIQLN
ncbi:glutamate racemase [Acidithiobacillus sp. M4-SHS-6]|uniref:glutamate racemase n=1 Tax=Acidithiobacillus sp. M4-SHS-6 TaxID=3383024 RepID=UPI0039BE036D